jgi:hypothetical protein
MAVQAFFIHGVLCAIPDTSEVAHNTYYTGGGSSGVWFTPSNAAPDVPEYVDHAVGDSSARERSSESFEADMAGNPLILSRIQDSQCKPCRDARLH